MSLWTPSGEHPVDRGARRTTSPSEPAETPRTVDPQQPAVAGDPGTQLTAEEQAMLEAELAEMRRQLEQTPAGIVVAQYALQFYELAAVHLSRTPPALEEARVAIDALAAVVDAVGGRLGAGEAPTREALRQLQLAFVELSKREGHSEPSV